MKKILIIKIGDKATQAFDFLAEITKLGGPKLTLGDMAKGFESLPLSNSPLPILRTLFRKEKR